MEMKKIDFESPVIVDLKDMAEVVYADTDGTSGSIIPTEPNPPQPPVIDDCWDISVQESQRETDSKTRFRLIGTHHKMNVEHIYDYVKVQVQFSASVTVSSNECVCEGSGMNWTLTRNGHGNGYQSGDNFNLGFEVFHEAGCHPSASVIGYTCSKSVNVQGKV